MQESSDPGSVHYDFRAGDRLRIHDNPVNTTEAWFGITSGFLVNPPTTSTEASRMPIQSHPYLCHFGAPQDKDLETAAYLDSTTLYLSRASQPAIVV